MADTDTVGQIELDVRLINPFIEAIQAVLSNEVGATISRSGSPGLTAGSKLPHEVTAIIGITGDLVGLVLISLPAESALKFFELVVGEAKDDIVRSAIAELANTIVGTASVGFKDMDLNWDISTPAVLQGKDAQLTTLNITRVAVPLETSLGPITLEIALSRTHQSSE